MNPYPNNTQVTFTYEGKEVFGFIEEQDKDNPNEYPVYHVRVPAPQVHKHKSILLLRSHDELEQTMTVREVLNTGGSFHYSPVSGGLLLMLNGDRVTNVPYSMGEFLELRNTNVIVHTGGISQGHLILHGKVQFYTLNPELIPPATA